MIDELDAGCWNADIGNAYIVLCSISLSLLVPSTGGLVYKHYATVQPHMTIVQPNSAVY